MSGGQCVGDGGRVHFFHSAHPVTSVYLFAEVETVNLIDGTYLTRILFSTK